MIKTEGRELVALAATALPLGAVMMLVSLNINLPRYFLEHSHGTYELGIFAALSYVIVAGNVFVFAVGQTFTPRLAKIYAAGSKREFVALSLKLCILGFAVGAAGILAAALLGSWALTLVYGPEYGEFVAEFIWVMAAGGMSFITCFIGCSVTAMRAFKEQLLPYAAVTVATLLSAWILVPAYGITGAAWALFIGNTVNAAYLALVAAILLKRDSPSL